MTAFSLEESKRLDPIQGYSQDKFTVPANIAELPAVSVPSKITSDGLPIGMQLIGRRFDEETIFSAASILERK